MAGRVADVFAVSALATIVTMAIAAPVLRAPSERLFGMAIVGRQYDPFVVMEQFEQPFRVGLYSQPVTDVAGRLLARVFGAVAAYNWLVLLTFPLAAAGAFVLARYLQLSRAGAAVAAIGYAFSPFHLAQAAYHLHIAQTQWLPLYLLALWHCLDEASPMAMGLLAAATAAVTLSSFYGGFIAAVITPAAVGAYWLVMSRTTARPWRRLGLTAGALALIAGAGLAYAFYAAHAVVVNPSAFAFARVDLFRYSAKWWAYLVPPVAHPLFGRALERFWAAAGVGAGLLEQQVSLGCGIVALGLVALGRWLVPARRVHGQASLARVPVLAIVAATAFVCSLSPEQTIGAFTLVRPSALLYDVAPMFRAYARFGAVVQLMAALLAGVGVETLRRAGSRRARIVCVVLLALVAGEYAVAPSAMSRDVLPTAAHRWVMQQTGRLKVLDCAPLTQESESVRWLTNGRVSLLGGPVTDCLEPNLPAELAANGFTHLLVRRDGDDGEWFLAHPLPHGLRVAARFDDAAVYAVTAPSPALYAAAMTGFSPRERDESRSWRWMGADATWTVVNASARPITATMDLELWAFDRPRHLEVRLDGHLVATLVVAPSRGDHLIGPFAVSSGDHTLAFHAVEAPTAADDVIRNGDRRPLSFAFGAWNWTTREERP